MANPIKFSSRFEALAVKGAGKKLLTSDAVFEPMRGKQPSGCVVTEALFLEVDRESQSG
ncbi:MAG: hypothetical protein Q7U14_01800 [Lacisediminimonas sp.]|nr:hypothetical protein [Lacisediminimonas sp.]